MKDKLKNDTVNSEGVKFDDKTIKQILLKGNYITEEDVKNADDFATTHQVSFIGYLLQENLITKDLLGQAIAESFKVPYADLNSAPFREGLDPMERNNILSATMRQNRRLFERCWINLLKGGG